MDLDSKTFAMYIKYVLMNNCNKQQLLITYYKFNIL